MAKATQNYTKPALRERLKKKIIAGDKGGKPGQWSARKAQLLAAEYKKAGGDYSSAKTSKQKHLDQWTDEKWTTRDGRKAQRKTKSKKKVTARYLPKKAWDELTAQEKKATDQKKRKASRGDRQFVGNTKKAQAARKKAVKAPARRKK